MEKVKKNNQATVECGEGLFTFSIRNLLLSSYDYETIEIVYLKVFGRFSRVWSSSK
jgi:hypothetical protein